MLDRIFCKEASGYFVLTGYSSPMTTKFIDRIGAGLLLMGLLPLGSTSTLAAEATTAENVQPSPVGSLIRSADDGWLDVSGFLDQAYGFLPVVVPITEPAVGLGAVGALAFIDKPQGEAGAGFGRPNISVVGALGTDNGTQGAMALDMRYWMDDRLQSLIAGVKASVNLDYYGSNEQGYKNKSPRSYKIDLTGAGGQARYRLGDSQNWLGLGYVLATTKATFDQEGLFADSGSNIRLGAVNFAFNHDSRDNMFTPRSGQYFEVSALLFNEALGSDRDFTRLGMNAMQYTPLGPKWSLGVREVATFNYGDAPFYMLPYVYMRGVPAMRYQGDQVMQLEGELRWQFWQRVSVVGFGGVGAAVKDFRDLSRTSDAAAGGVGLRYEIARKYGLHAGLDVAWGRDGPAVYIQVGSAWMRP